MTTSSTDTRLQLTDEVILSQLGETRFTAAVIERGIPHTLLTHWTTAAGSLDAVVPHALTTVRDRRESSALLDLEPLFGPDALALVRLTGGTIYVSLAGPEPAVLDDLERWLREVLPPARSTEEREVPVSFWSHGAHGPRAFSRRIVVPEWSGIADNYPSAVREQLTRLVSPSFRPAQGGQLLLWYGPPGTGKTYALRALGWEWRRWCSMHYVVDPEVFFGTRAGYMLEVVLDEDDDDDEGGDGRWRLLVLEDTGELLAADAKQQTGQGLSRLLNLVDGMVGQGLRVLVLVTTNEPLRRLHPAVSRPGRCAARIEFAPFAGEESAHWLAGRGLASDEVTEMTLADLFARAAGATPEPVRRVGF